ncbi:MAG: sugar transferase, partial [Tepidisphaeraceae bacterium]
MGSGSTPWRDVSLAERSQRPRGLQSLYTRPQLEAVLHRERARADRNRMEFSLVLFRSRGEELRMTARLARMLLRRSRGTDELGWFDASSIAVLLPYTAADGARAFAENALKQAQEELVPAICRVYTYPSAWYFEDDAPRNGDGQDRHDGNGNGNGHESHAEPHAAQGGNGNGYANGEGENGSGNGLTMKAEMAKRVDRIRSSASADAPFAAAPSRREFEPGDLMPYLLQGVTDELHSADAGLDGVETLLVKRLPSWKRALDIVGATAGLVLLSPVMILSAILIKGTSRGPVIFKQRRAGLGGRPFRIYKFRTMSSDAEARKATLRAQSEQDGPAFKLASDPRVTPVGRILRETSLDELPQLWNVLKGDMSLVGPRPLPMDEAAECLQWQRRRLDVTPGLTCIWQVKGRSRVTFVEWMRMDVDYIRVNQFNGTISIIANILPVF